MLDPVAVRSYLGSLGQQQGGGQGGGGIQAMLANLRQRLYGQQALQGGGLGGGQVSPEQQAQVGQYLRSSGVLQGPETPQQPNRPAWQVLRDAGMQGQGSAAANRAAAGALPAAQPQIGGGRFPGGVADLPAAYNQPGVRGALQQMQSEGGAAMGESGPIENVGGGMRGIQGMQRPTSGGGGAALSGAIPETNGGLQFQSGGGLTAPNAGFQPGPAVNELPLNQGQAVPMVGKPATPVALGAAQFQGPNARRIVNARQGIFNNVQQALRRPRQAAPAAATGSKVGG